MTQPASSAATALRLPKSLLKRQLQWLLFLRVMLLSVLLAANLLLTESISRKIVTPPLEYVSYFIAGVYLFTIVSAFILRQAKDYIAFGYCQVLIDSLLVSILVYFSGGNQSIFTSIYFFPIIAGSFILLRRGGLAVAASSTLGYGAILLLEYLKYQPQYFFQFWYLAPSSLLVVANFFAIHGITFFLVAILSAMFSVRLQRTETALSQTTQNFDQLSVLYKQIFDDITTGIITIDNQFRITSINPAAEKILGYSTADILHQPLHEKLPDIELKQRGRIRPATALSRKDGTRIPVGYSWTPLHTRDGSEDCQVITLQDLSEIKKMEDQVRQAEKMAALGEMAAGLAHEFRNPLAAISGSAQMLRNELGDNQMQHGLMKIIVRECTRLEKSIADFLQFSKPAVPEREWLLLENLLEDAVALLKQSPDWRDNISILSEIPEKFACWGDAQQLKRVLINLIQNACSALDNAGGEIRVMARETTDDDGQEKCLINIIDSGPGIPPALADKIFNPFFTTRDSGTGLGLAIVHQIIDSHRGNIKVENCGEDDAGANFAITLPLP
jgi:two-component system sensor histidine kinase PilS (NtrC family)